jgi:hypothetical protein
MSSPNQIVKKLIVPMEKEEFSSNSVPAAENIT